MFTLKKRIAASFLFVGLAFLLLSLEAQPALAIPTFQAASITLDHTSGAPGTQVVVQGSDFQVGANVQVHWDVDWGAQIGAGSVGSDGKFTAIATIPPNASTGAHQIIALCDCTSPHRRAAAGFGVAGRKLKAVYIYDTDLSKAQWFEYLVEGDGMLDTDLITLSAADTTDFSLYDLIIIGPDTGSILTPWIWGTVTAINRVKNSGKPILGLGYGGYAFFGRLFLKIGNPNPDPFRQTTDLQAVDSSHTIYRTPYSGFPSVITAYISNTTTVEIMLGVVPVDAFPLGMNKLENDCYPLIQQAGRYFLWGFDGGPADMTAYGKNLFVNVVWYMLHVRTDVDTLILADYQRMKDIGYSATSVNTLESTINTLVGKPRSDSKMTAVVKRLNLDTSDTLRAARTGWGLSTSVIGTNLYVMAIDDYIEDLKRGSYPNLKYVMLVGAHEVIPMKARKVETTSPLYENKWAEGLPQKSGYLYMLYHNTSGGASRGHYLTDSIYGDLSYVDNGHGADNELIPELAVGRLVETPSQITTLLNNYMGSKGTLSRSGMVSIGSWDYLDGAQRAANHMGASADTALIQEGFVSSLVPPKINTHNDIVYIGGHGDYNSTTTRKWDQKFMAGSDNSQGDTEELNLMPNAVIVSSGCHNGVNFGNQLYHDYDNTTKYGDFPERFANRGAGIYLGCTAYSWVSISGSSSDPNDASGHELLATNFLNHLLHDGFLATAGRAYKAAVNDHVTIFGGFSDGIRLELGCFTFYGIPNYGWPQLVIPNPWLPVGHWWSAQWRTWPLGSPASGVQAMATEDVTLEITGWSVDPDGLINIPGASYSSNYDEPILPVVHTSRLLPAESDIVEITWNQAASESTTISNDVPLAAVAVHTTPIPNTFSYDGFYPPTPYYTSTLSTLGGGGVEVGLTIVPVQYDQSTHQTRIWTKMAFDLEYEVDQDALSRDSDGDGLPDYWESGYGLNPNDAEGDQGASGDPDQDGLTNAQEHGLGTNPLDPDTDHDGVNDGLEVDKGTDPLNPGSRSGDAYLPAVTRSYTGTVSSQ